MKKDPSRKKLHEFWQLFNISDSGMYGPTSSCHRKSRFPVKHGFYQNTVVGWEFPGVEADSLSPTDKEGEDEEEEVC